MPDESGSPPETPPPQLQTGDPSLIALAVRQGAQIAKVEAVIEALKEDHGRRIEGVERAGIALSAQVTSVASAQVEMKEEVIELRTAVTQMQADLSDVRRVTAHSDATLNEMAPLFVEMRTLLTANAEEKKYHAWELKRVGSRQKWLMGGVGLFATAAVVYNSPLWLPLSGWLHRAWAGNPMEFLVVAGILLLGGALVWTRYPFFRVGPPAG